MKPEAWHVLSYNGRNLNKIRQKWNKIRFSVLSDSWIFVIKGKYIEMNMQGSSDHVVSRFHCWAAGGAKSNTVTSVAQASVQSASHEFMFFTWLAGKRIDPHSHQYRLIWFIWSHNGWTVIIMTDYNHVRGVTTQTNSVC